jgi:hypothetical protein
VNSSYCSTSHSNLGLALLPEALHQVTIVMSDRGIPRSFRNMHGFGSHTYSFLNAKDERTWVKFHFRSQQGIRNLTDAEAEALIGKDRETHQRDLFENIEAGRFPRWTLFIQVMSDAQAKAFPFNPFDLTKVWPKAAFPLIEVGFFELNRNPDNFFAEVEQAAFSPANVVPGISRLTRCCRRGYSHTAMPSAIVSASISITSPSTRPSVRFTAITATGRCAPTAISGERQATSPIAGASGPISRGSTSHRWRSMARRPTGTIASTTTTISSRVTSSGR